MFLFHLRYILNFMQIYEKRKYNTKKIRKIKYIFVTVTTHTLGCSGWLLDHLMPWGAIFVYQLLMQKRVRCCICLNSSVSDNFFNF